MKNKVHELKIILDSNEIETMESFRAKLISLGVGEQKIVELVQGGKTALCLIDPSADKISRVQSQLLAWRRNDFKLLRRTLQDKDWLNLWKESFKSFYLTDTIQVIPVWEKSDYKNDNTDVIFIDTQLAFGTGLHETTRFMAQLIERCGSRFKSFLDVGTGTGILTMVALKKGAQEVLAVDIEESSINMARKNMRVNGYESIPLRFGDISAFSSSKKYDFVAANLITQDLIRLKKKIFSFVAPRQYLAISGVSLANLPVIKKSFKSLPLRCLKICKGEEWAALLYIRERVNQG